LTFAKVFTQPLRRAVRTCEMTGFCSAAEIDPDLVEWDYGRYEPPHGRDPCGAAGLESATAAPGDKRRTRSVPGPTASSAGCARSKATCWFFRTSFPAGARYRWLGFRAAAGQHFLLDTASLSALGYECKLTRPAIRL
jgi:probable phosphoglycerate mutase